ncbi:MAG: N-acetyltransferase [Deltaproteobacteria bacterium]|nr:N-acetyltransferase [Deltaproteobacteria bacterium]
MNSNIRLATEADAQALLFIYEPYIRDTVITFEIDSPGVDEFRRRIRDTMKCLPWLVFEDEGKIVGYAYAGRHHERAAYQWSANVSVYLASTHHRKGIGKKLYTELFRILRAQGYYTLYGGITLPNAASVAIHESFGFKPTAMYANVGYKFGKWHDVGWWYLPLRPYDRPAGPPDPDYRL